MTRRLTLVALALLLVPALAAPTQPPPGSLFARENLLAWCIVPYDSLHRRPAERIAMLRELGFTQYVWDWRQQHLADLPEEIRAARAGGVRMRGVWLWIDAKADAVGRLGAANRAVVDAVDAAQLPLEFWVGMHDNVFEGLDDAARLKTAAAWFSYLREVAAGSRSTVALYNHGGWFGEPENQLRVIEAAGPTTLGIVYNFHHAYNEASRFAAVLPRMLPYLRAVNLSGVVDGRPNVIPIGAGTREREMLRVLQASGYAGPIGILGHTEGEDVALALQRNLAGLRAIVPSR
ncbi:MAG TPA: TIM barrel protein [Gemmatimonadales bacterium]|nr:TIM barrel protein [Gemmatimonadales bacterium]